MCYANTWTLIHKRQETDKPETDKPYTLSSLQTRWLPTSRTRYRPCRHDGFRQAVHAIVPADTMASDKPYALSSLQTRWLPTSRTRYRPCRHDGFRQAVHAIVPADTMASDKPYTLSSLQTRWLPTSRTRYRPCRHDGLQIRIAVFAIGRSLMHIPHTLSHSAQSVGFVDAQKKYKYLRTSSVYFMNFTMFSFPGFNHA